MTIRKTILIYLLSATSLLVAGNFIPVAITGHSFSIDYSPSHYFFSIEGNRTRVSFDGAGMFDETGTPDLPILSEYCLLSRSGIPRVAVWIESSDTVFAPPPTPVEPATFENGRFDGFPNNESNIYNSDEIYPAECAEIRYVGDVRGNPLGLLSFYPIQYDFKIGAFIVHRKARIDVDLGASFTPPLERLRSRPFMELLGAITINGNIMPSPIEGDPGTYLIICPDNCWSAITEFVDHKVRRGHRVILKRLSDFGSSPNKNLIKQYIQAQYDTLNPAPTFVILVGDNSMADGTLFPHFGYGSYASDHSYSLLSGTDYFSDVFLCRWPIDYSAECQVVIKKSVWFENTPTSHGSDWLLRAFVCATYDHAITPVWNVLWVWQLLREFGFTRVDTFFQRGTVIPTPAEISAPINAGLLYITYRGWAGSDGWWEPNFTRTHVLALTNSNAYPIVTSIVCGTGDFASMWVDPCFGEAWLRAGSATNPRGAVAFFGTTDHSTHTRYNNPINSGFYRGILELKLPLFSQNVWLAEAECFRQHPREYSNIELYFHSYEAFGDPGLYLYRGIPHPIEVVHDTISNGALLSINAFSLGAPLRDALVCLYRKGSGESAIAYTDYHGYAEIPVPGSGVDRVIITVTKPFHIPYRDSVWVSDGPRVSIAGLSVSDTDGDGYLEPFENGSISVRLRNSGSRIRRMETYLWTNHHGIEIVDGFDSVSGFLWNTEREVRFEVSANGSAIGGGPARMNIICDTREGRVYLPFDIQIKPGSIRVDSIGFNDAGTGDGDGLLEPGESASAFVWFTNNSDFSSERFTADFLIESGWIGYGSEMIDVPSIPARGIGRSSGKMVSASENAFRGRAFSATVIKKNIFGHDEKIGSADFTLGRATIFDPTGPDDYGYYAYDDNDVSSGYAPASAFRDISSTGTFVSVGDDTKFEVVLPFPFIYYGESFDTLTICSNGFAAMGVQPWFMVTFYNTPIPAPNGPWGILALFWDDIKPISGGGVYYQHFPADGEYIIQWNRFQHARIAGMNNTFQLVLFDPSRLSSLTGDSEFEFRYTGLIANIDTVEEYSTVGIESPGQTDGLQYIFSSIYSPGASIIEGGRSIRFTTDHGTATLSGRVSMADGGDPTTARIGIAFASMLFGHSVPSADGTYRLHDIQRGTKTVSCSAPYYFDETTSVDFVSDRAETRDFVMHPVPVPQGFSASKDDGSGTIALSWRSVSASGHSLEGYVVEKFLIPFIQPQIIEVADTFYIDAEVGAGRKYWYRVRSLFEGSFSSRPSAFDSGWVDLPTRIDESELPKDFSLAIAPNPFNSALEIAIETASEAKLAIFDINGRAVYSREFPAGRTRFLWNGCDGENKTLPSGIYLVRLQSNKENKVIKAVLLR